MNRLERLRQQLRDLLARRDAERTELLGLASAAEDLTDEQEARWAELSPRFSARDGQPAWAEDDQAERLTNEIASLEAVERGFQAGHTERVGLTLHVPNTESPFRRGVEHAPAGEVRSAALRAIEAAEEIPDSVRSGADERLRRLDLPDGRLARHILTTGRPEYRAAFMQLMAGREAFLTDEQRAAVTSVRGANITTDSLGGYAMPYVLDPTFINLDANDGQFSVWRQLADVRQAVADNWHGVTVTGVSASMTAEATEVAESDFTLASVSIDIKKAHAFMKYTIEAEQDLSGLESEIRTLFMFAKMNLEDTQFTTGSGSGNNVHGIITDMVADTSQVIPSSTSNAFVAADVYALEEALGRRYRQNATFVANRPIYNKVRQIDTAGGAALWERIGNGLPAQLIGYPIAEETAMDGTYGSGENYVLLFGDIRQTYRILDRVGMTIEPVPMVFGTGNNYPTGERGLYLYWRFGAAGVNTNASVLLNVT